MSKYDGYKWIKVKKYEFCRILSWEESYDKLVEHHNTETEFLIREVRSLAKLLTNAKEELEFLTKHLDRPTTILEQINEKLKS